MEEEPSPKRLKPNTPEKLFTFQLRLQPQLTPLKHSIASLCDSEFNPSSLGSLKVTPENGFEILVQNSQTQVTGFLNLTVNKLHNFQCKKPIVNYMINLNQVYQILLYDLDSEAVHIEVFLVDGSNKISFLFCGSSAPITEFHVDLLQTNVGNEHNFPHCISFSVAVFHTVILRQMIERIEQNGTHQLVSVDITEALVTIFVGLFHPWRIKCSDDVVIKLRRYRAGTKHHAWFQLHHLNSLKKASYMAPCLNLYLLLDPSNKVLFLFKLGFGDLLFLDNAIKLSGQPETHENCDCTAAIASPPV